MRAFAQRRIRCSNCVEDAGLTSRLNARWQEQGATADENLPVVLIGSFEIADNRLRGGISRLLDDPGAEPHDVAFESRVGMSN